MAKIICIPLFLSPAFAAELYNTRGDTFYGAIVREDSDTVTMQIERIAADPKNIAESQPLKTGVNLALYAVVLEDGSKITGNMTPTADGGFLLKNNPYYPQNHPIPGKNVESYERLALTNFKMSDGVVYTAHEKERTDEQVIYEHILDPPERTFNRGEVRRKWPLLSNYAVYGFFTYQPVVSALKDYLKSGFGAELAAMTSFFRPWLNPLVIAGFTNFPAQTDVNINGLTAFRIAAGLGYPFTVKKSFSFAPYAAAGISFGKMVGIANRNYLIPIVKGGLILSYRLTRHVRIAANLGVAYSPDPPLSGTEIVLALGAGYVWGKR